MSTNTEVNVSEVFHDTQRWLSKKQTTFIAGPLLGSPAKMLVSTAQMIYGLAKTIFYGLGSLFSKNSDYKVSCKDGIDNIYKGFFSFIYAYGNILTLGVFGKEVEKELDYFETKTPFKPWVN